jgi:hypothetical protein
MAEETDTPETRMARLILALRSQGVTDPKVLNAIETNGPGRIRRCRSPAARRSASRSSSG